MAQSPKIHPRDVSPEQHNNSSDDASNDSEKQIISDRALLRRLDLKLLPPLSLLYLLSFLDRSNVGNARIEGLTKDLHMTGNEYLTGLTLFFIGYVLFEVPANIVLKLWTPQLWLPTITIVWGIVATLLGVVQNKGGDKHAGVQNNKNGNNQKRKVDDSLNADNTDKPMSKTQMKKRAKLEAARKADAEKTG